MNTESAEFREGMAAGVAGLAFSNPYRPYSVAARDFQRGHAKGTTATIARQERLRRATSPAEGARCL